MGIPAAPSSLLDAILERAAAKSLFSSLRMRLVATIFIAIAPPMAFLYYFHLEEWAGFLVGLVALAAAWYGGERYIMRQLRILLDTTQRLAAGDLST